VKKKRKKKRKKEEEKEVEMEEEEKKRNKRMKKKEEEANLPTVLLSGHVCSMMSVTQCHAAGALNKLMSSHGL
jgi:glutaredoxin